MSRIVYRTDYFKCSFSTAKRFNEQLQALLDRYAAEGWRLHSYQQIGMGEMCSVIFYREEES